MKIAALILFINFCVSVSAQTFYPYKDIIINFNEEECFGYDAEHYIESDSLNYHILLESFFSEDKIKVLSNDSIIFHGSVTTDNTIGFANEILLGNINEITKFKIQINNSTIITCSTYPDKRYIRIGLSWDRTTLIICYSEYRPVYY